MRVTAFTHEGTYPVNEDSIKRFRQNGIFAFVIVDGEGVGCGDIASTTVIDAIEKAFETEPRIAEDAVSEYFEKAQLALNEKSQEDAVFENMYAGAVMLITDGEKAVWDSIGDCRLYRFSGSRLEEVTEDDTAAFEKYESGKIDYSDIRNENLEKPNKVIDSKERCTMDSASVVSVKENASFLLCSKGFWRAVTEEEMENALRSTSSSKEWLAKMLSDLENKKLAKCENISAFAVKMR